MLNLDHHPRAELVALDELAGDDRVAGGHDNGFVQDAEASVGAVGEFKNAGMGMHDRLMGCRRSGRAGRAWLE